MSVLFVVLPIALFVAAVAVGAFIWAVRDGQLDDLQSPAMRVFDDDDKEPRAKGGPIIRSERSPDPESEDLRIG